MARWSVCNMYALLIICYLGIIVAANALVLRWGQPALLVTALVLVPIDFAIRVRLQEHWQGRGLWLRLAALMAAGAFLTAVTLPEASRLVTASVLAFLAASLAGAISYQAVLLLVLNPASIDPVERNVARSASLVSMALVDSAIFPVLAFEHASVVLMLLQAVLKTLVGVLVLLMWQMIERKDYDFDGYL